MTTESFGAILREAWQHLSAPTPVPSPSAALAAVVVALLLVMHPRGYRALQPVVTVVHEAGHAAAALLTGGSVRGIRVHRDSSGLTTTVTRGGWRTGLVSFLGYPFPAVVGAALVWAAVSGSARLASAVAGVALLVILMLTRNLHGAFVVFTGLGAVAAAAWYLPGDVLATVLLGAGAFLAAAAVRDLLGERRYRRQGGTGSDTAALAASTGLPAPVWWFAMLAVVAGVSWWVGSSTLQDYGVAGFAP